FALKVRGWRENRGFSQEQLAERANLHRTYISDIERAARNPSLESIHKLASALEVPLAVLFTQKKPGSFNGQNGSRDLVEILLVDDNPDDVALALRAFKGARFANRVEVLHDGAAALDYLFGRGSYAGRTDGLPQVVLLDLDLPKVGG